MATLPPAPDAEQKARLVILRSARRTFVLVLIALLVLCMVFAWTTRDAMSHLPFIAATANAPADTSMRKAAVDLSPWQTAQALAPLAVTAEETELAREAERLADHEVDQAFAAALRLANIESQHRSLTGDALVLSQKIAQLQQLVAQDQAEVTAASGPAKTSDSDLEIAKAQLGLDSDELADAQLDLERASGDQRAQIQSELAQHEAAMRKYDAQAHAENPTAILSAGRYGTLAERLKAWNQQRSRSKLVQQALQEAQQDIRTLTQQHTDLERKANTLETGATGNDRTSKLASLRDRSAQRQLLSIFDDRIQTEQQLASVYGKWSAQVALQHRIMLHLLLQSFAMIFFILICMLLGDGLVRRIAPNRAFDRRQIQTLRMILILSIQLLGALLILLVIFGAPRQMPTILGLTTAALTIALQDFVLAFFGWFVLMGKRGIRIGDWVEINGVGGEVTELGLMKTTLMETGSLPDRGYPTGRRITFMNSFAIRGQYFNFSTTGQWMWDEITLAIPEDLDRHAAMDRILKEVQEETGDDTRIAAEEWARGTRAEGLEKLRVDPVVNLRPSSSGIDIEVRYVTRASQRFETRNRLYRRLLDVLHAPSTGAQAETVRDSGAHEQVK